MRKGPPSTSERDAEIYSLHGDGKTSSELAQQFSLSEPRVQELIRRQRWNLNSETNTAKRSKRYKTRPERRQWLGYKLPGSLA